MTWGRARRRAEEFDALVEGAAAPGDLTSVRDAALPELLELVGALRAVPQVDARPEFVSDLRGRLMAAAETELVPDDLSRLRLPERSRRRERRLAAVVGGIAVVGATTSLAVASQSALPGDSLYPVKRVIEQAHTGISIGDGSKGATMLANAGDRLDEVDALTRRDGIADDARIADTLDAFTDQATEASDLLLADYASTGHASSITQLRDFAAASLDRLASLEPLVPESARDELIRAAGVLGTIDSEAARRCSACGGAGITTIPPVLAAAHETIVVPQQPIGAQATASGPRHHRGHRDGRGGAQQPSLPDVDPGQLGPGSVAQGGDTTAAGGGGGGGLPTGGASDGSDPIGTLTQGLTGGGGSGGGKGDIPTDTSSVVGGAVNDVEDLLNGIVDPLTGGSTPSP